MQLDPILTLLTLAGWFAVALLGIVLALYLLADARADGRALPPLPAQAVRHQLVRGDHHAARVRLALCLCFLAVAAAGLGLGLGDLAPPTRLLLRAAMQFLFGLVEIVYVAELWVDLRARRRARALAGEEYGDGGGAE